MQLDTSILLFWFSKNTIHIRYFNIDRFCYPLKLQADAQYFIFIKLVLIAGMLAIAISRNL